MKHLNNLTPKAKLLSQYMVIILMGFSLSIVSCKKKEAKPIAKITDVYVAGSVILTNGNKAYDTPAYWKNGTQNLLSQLEAGSVTAITVHGNDVYAVGYLYANPDQIVYWRNTDKGVVIADANMAYARGIAVSSDGHVYIVGYDISEGTHFAKYWKDGNLMPLSAAASEAYSIAVSNTNVYVSGYENNSTYNIATYWKIGTPAGTVLATEDTPTKNSYGYGIAVSGTDVYVSGREGSTVKYWKNNKTNVFSIGTNTSYTYFNGIAVKGSDVYVAGYDFDFVDFKPKYWKGTAETFLTADAQTTTTASQIAVVGNDVYVTGLEATNNTSYLWKNGGLVAPFNNGNTTINATALCVVEK